MADDLGKAVDGTLSHKGVWVVRPEKILEPYVLPCL